MLNYDPMIPVRLEEDRSNRVVSEIFSGTLDEKLERHRRRNEGKKGTSKRGRKGAVRHVGSEKLSVS